MFGIMLRAQVIHAHQCCVTGRNLSIEDLFGINGWQFILPSPDGNDLLTPALFSRLPIRQVGHIPISWASQPCRRKKFRISQPVKYKPEPVSRCGPRRSCVSLGASKLTHEDLRIQLISRRRSIACYLQSGIGLLTILSSLSSRLRRRVFLAADWKDDGGQRDALPQGAPPGDAQARDVQLRGA